MSGPGKPYTRFCPILQGEVHITQTMKCQPCGHELNETGQQLNKCPLCRTHIQSFKKHPLSEKAKNAAALLTATLLRQLQSTKILSEVIDVQSASRLQAVVRRCIESRRYPGKREDARIERSCRSMYRISQQYGSWNYEWFNKLQGDLLTRYPHLTVSDIDNRIAAYIDDEKHTTWLENHARPQTEEDNNTVLQDLRKLILQKGMPPCGYTWGNFDPEAYFTKQWYDDHGPSSPGDTLLYTDTARAYCLSNPHSYYRMPFVWTQDGINRRRHKWMTSWH